MERNEQLESIRALIAQGDTAAAMTGMLDTITALMDEVDILIVQLETVLDCMGGDEDEYPLDDECSYVVTCSQCGCLLEVDSELIEDEEAELSCPQCGAVLEF